MLNPFRYAIRDRYRLVRRSHPNMRSGEIVSAWAVTYNHVSLVLKTTEKVTQLVSENCTSTKLPVISAAVIVTI